MRFDERFRTLRKSLSPDPAMHTAPTQSEPTLADLKQTMIRIQIAALETLERCMQTLGPSGDDKKDRAQAQQLNRQRLCATQTLLHCRTMFRELREAEAQDHRIAEEKKQAEKKAIFDLANLRRLHQTYPGQYDDPDAPGGFAEGGMATQRVALQDAESTQASEDKATLRVAMPPSPCSGATGGSPASAGPPQPDPHPGNARAAGANPSRKPIPTDIGKTLAAQIIALVGTTQGLKHTPP